jgi:uncharacterized protein (TIGR03435 family)
VLPGGRYVATNMPVRLLIGRVYGVPSVRLLGGPSWIESEHFDIAARLNSESSPDVGVRSRRIEAALRALLEDRFKLVLHTETRQMPIYHLLLARRDGRLGSNLTRSSRTDCETRLAVQASAGGPPAPPPPPETGAQAPPCGVRSLVGRFWVDSVPLTTVAALMTGEVGRVVVDKTGLTGRYTGHLTWTPFQAPNRAAESPDDVQSIDPNGASLFSAVQEQLGLKLQAAMGPVDVLVIDSIERPTAD